MGEKWIVYSDKSAPKICFKTPTECVKLADCFIVHKLSRWFYHTDGKRCASCLTCSDEALGRRSNDFTRIATFEIISNHYYELIQHFLRQDSGQFNKLSIVWKGRKQISRQCVWRKTKVMFAAPLIYLNYTVDDSLKTFELKNI